MNFGNQRSLQRTTETLSRIAAVFSAAVGLVVVFGWLFDIVPVISISPGFATMKLNTAVAFVLLGVALWSAPARSDLRSPVKGDESLSPVCRVCGALVALIGLLTLSEYFFAWAPRIDNLVIQDHHAVHNPHRGRMTAMTALDLFLLGLAFLIMDFETPSGKRPAQWLAIATFFDGFVAVLGYAYGVESLYHIGGYSSMALHTALLVALLSAGLLCARPGKGLMVLATDTTAGGWIFRFLLPTALLVAPLLGWLKLLGQRAGLYDLGFGTALLVLSNVAVLSALIWWAGGFVRAESLDRTQTEQRMGMDQARVKEQAALLEQRVRERTAELQETVAEIERSTHTISHNLRAPVRAVLAFADFLHADCGEELGTKGRDYLDRIRAAAKRMDRLIEDVLAYSRVSRSELSLTSVDLDRLVDAIVPDHAGAADIRVSHPLGIVRANECLLDQAVSNLLENAAKFVQPGSRAQIEVWTQPEDGRLRLVIHDHGIGVPLESGHRIFRPFEQAHKGYPGTGIGLAIVKRSVERMDGLIGFDSKPGNGSSFWVELPKA